MKKKIKKHKLVATDLLFVGKRGKTIRNLSLTYQEALEIST